MSVEWMDRDGPLALDGEFDRDWLTPVTPEEFERLSTELRRTRREREDKGRAAGRTYMARPNE